MEKIVITGGLGYLGTELCKIYSGEARYKNIVVIDNRFISERVKQLRDWGIDFVHGDILDKNLIKEILKNSNIIYHLAGITNVAYTKTEANDELDRSIQEVGVTGSEIVIECAPKTSKLIFPSTHVVFEGFEKTKLEISEDENTCPVLSYASGKAQTEKDLINSDLDFVVLRLGSVVGYSQDTMRINIMPNLFSKITSQNGTIKLFSGGVQQKSLVTIFDVVRCFKFMAEAEEISREIFHCASENMTVKEVAQICEQFNQNLKIAETDDEIPNLGYTISNKKLLETGFEFKHNIKESIRQMVENWSARDTYPELEQIQGGEKEFIDERGKISNYELTEPINLIGYIESKAGTVRANHFHPIQEQKCLLVKGKYVSVLKDLSDPNAVIETNIINAGDLSSIHPNVAHTMVFLEDSIFLNLVRGEREHKNYGVTHTMFYELVDEKFRETILDCYKFECRSCGNEHLKQVVSLGMSPLANNLLKNIDQEEELFPLEMNYCPNCHNCQLSFVVSPEKMFDNYLYVSSTSKIFRHHFSKLADILVKDFKLNEKSLVLDIGSNDGIFLKPLKEKGIGILGIDPAKNVSELANKDGIETITGYFNETTANVILKDKGPVDLITAFNVFAHSDDLEGIAKNSFNILKDEGTLIIEVQYLLDTIKDLTFDNIYHEHVNYWSVTSMDYFFKKLNLQIFKVEHVDTHGGSIRAYVRRDKNDLVDASVETFLTNESNFGIKEFDTYKAFGKQIKDLKEETLRGLNHLKDKKKTIVGYGSPAKATTVLNYYGISNEYIDYIIEDNELKHNYLLPGMKIPIKGKIQAINNPPDYILVLAWNFFEDIKKNNEDLINAGCKFITLKELSS